MENTQHIQQPTQFIIKRQKERQMQESIDNLLRQQLSAFYKYTVKQHLKQAGATDKQQQQAVQLFIQERNQQNQIEINKDNFGELIKFQKSIVQLRQILSKMIVQSRKEQKKCIQILSIMNLKYSNLKVIYIQYPLIENHFHRYSISAFEFFKVVLKNKLLKQVTLKGVLVYDFQQFIEFMNRKEDHNEKSEKKDELSQLKELKSSKGIKLNIDAELFFIVSNKNHILSTISDLNNFGQLFYWLSDISAIVQINEWSQTNDWTDNLQNLWKCLHSIKRLKLTFLKAIDDQVKVSQAQVFRSLVFGGLSSFTEINHLIFSSIKFGKQFDLNEFLAIEQKLAIIFKNNKLSHLQLNWCKNFPLLPQTSSLLSIRLLGVSFRAQFGFMKKIVESNLSLKSIQCQKIQQQFQINQYLFRQLDIFIIKGCNGISFEGLSSQSPSSIRHLCIFDSNKIGKIDSLSRILPKLTNISSLQLSDIDFNDQFLCAIPSPNLQELRILWNHKITNKGVQAIDNKWPSLKHIGIIECEQITFSVWGSCKLKELVSLQVDRRILGPGNKITYQLKSRGIKVDFS